MSTNDADGHTGSENAKSLSFGQVIGVTDNGVPVFSNGDKAFCSNEISVAPNAKHIGIVHPVVITNAYEKLGYKWLALEFARRYLAMTKGLWLASVPTAEELWDADDVVTEIPSGVPVTVSREKNGATTNMPSAGDLFVWGRSATMPFGHLGVVTHSSNSWVRIAEQNNAFERWPAGENYSRQIERRVRDDGIVEFVDEDQLLGWINIQVPAYDFNRGDLPDNYRHILSSGHIARYHVEREVTLPWVNTAERCDFFLKRSLTIDGNMGDNAMAQEKDVPDGYYLMDYDMWSRFRYAANSLHEVAMEATRRILNDPDSETLLIHYFGVPKELHQQLHKCFKTTPSMCGRFDFGYNGKDVIMLEYNCDSSAAMLECGDTQEKMARHYGLNIGTSTGSFLFTKIVNYFKCLLQDEYLCPSHELIHFMIDDNDEERYTALYAMNAAETAGFRTKLCVKLTDFRYAASSTSSVSSPHETDHPTIVDLENEEVLLVWKTWAWDTVLHQYAEQHVQEGIRFLSKPSLSDILLNERIRVLEPFWKAVTGSKAILPFMHAVAPRHPNMVPASFQRTKEIISGHYLSKPVNGRAGQNILMYDPETDKDVLAAAPSTDEAPALSRSVSIHLFDDTPANLGCTSLDEGNESSTGRFFESAVVYQSRIFLSRYEQKYFPIFCGWSVGGEFGGIVVREDTSKITKLASLVVPARVVREHTPLRAARSGAENGEAQLVYDKQTKNKLA
ncbi:putative trypanothione synthetase [Trypanosoma grayi]|uniref:putative trypanothione synthetase n=1 Tax=Trypanosoma grayi TaxID=71804 RepID=UPI0004F42A31|nr:putative trypanothione synthetase [Trypanosoma grayi]KEG10463.1 putative trypanothione synthetase [Trypanosoma grayi]